uniref:Uncharacterized protein n=1 Tax=Ascaris lumbricoides TaxID=6252 RepID=A0A0M3HHS9_ASCLU
MICIGYLLNIYITERNKSFIFFNFFCVVKIEATM